MNGFKNPNLAAASGANCVIQRNAPGHPFKDFRPVEIDRAMANQCHPRDNGERLSSPEPVRSRSPRRTECGTNSLGSMPVVCQWPQLPLGKVLEWMQQRFSHGVYRPDDLDDASRAFSDILSFCGHRTATLPFAMCLRVCVQLQEEMGRTEAAAAHLPRQNQIPLFGYAYDPLPPQRPLSHLRYFPEEKKHRLRISLAFSRPLFTKMLSLEQGLQQYLALSDFQCLLDDVLYFLVF